MNLTRRVLLFGFPAAFLQTGSRAEKADTVVAGGVAFGTEVDITLPATVRNSVVKGAFAEIRRLESIFTLLDPKSPLRRLNEAGHLKDPPRELRETLLLCDRVHRLTEGAFDPTVQPLWELYERHFAENPTDTAGPSKEKIARVRSRIGWENVEISPEEIRFGVDGMAMTLNGIAPGFAADRIAGYLEDAGVGHALVNVGEYRAVGTRPDGSRWKIGIRGSEGLVGHANLNGNALATSAGYATAFDLEAQFHHIFDPRGDRFQPARRTIAVEAETAAMADALATAGGVLGAKDFQRMVEGVRGARARIFEG